MSPGVHVLCRYSLVAQAVSVGLLARGIHTECWDARDADEPIALRRRVKASDIIVRIDELGSEAELHRTLRLVGEVPARWLVLTERPRGRGWGALLAAGAVVLPASIVLDELDEALQEMWRGSAPGDPAERDELVAAWMAHRVRGEELARRMATLNPEQLATLELMLQGCGVAEITDRTSVSEATVRSRIRGVLRTLGVTSRLEAVAAARQAMRTDVYSGPRDRRD